MKLAELEKTSSVLDNYLSELNNQTKSDYKTKVYNGLDGIKQLLWNVLTSQTEILYYTGANRKRIFGEKWFYQYRTEFVKRGLHERGFESDRNSAINLPAYFSDTPGYLERCKYLILENMNLDGEIYVYNDVYAYYNWNNNVYYGVEIYDKSIVTTQRVIFEQFWSLASKADTLKSSN